MWSVVWYEGGISGKTFTFVTLFVEQKTIMCPVEQIKVHRNYHYFFTSFLVKFFFQFFNNFSLHSSHIFPPWRTTLRNLKNAPHLNSFSLLLLLLYILLKLFVRWVAACSKFFLTFFFSFSLVEKIPIFMNKLMLWLMHNGIDSCSYKNYYNFRPVAMMLPLCFREKKPSMKKYEKCAFHVKPNRPIFVSLKASFKLTNSMTPSTLQEQYKTSVKNEKKNHT